MSKRLLGSFVLLVVILASMGVCYLPGVRAQDSGKSVSKAEKGGDEKGAKKKTGDRLPANYAKIGLSEDQKKKVYDVQGKYDAQISALEKQIADLKAKESSEVEAILTDAQKKALQDANEETKKKSAEKKKASVKEEAKPKEKSDK